jgi:hypothetical protein
MWFPNPLSKASFSKASFGKASILVVAIVSGCAMLGLDRSTVTVEVTEGAWNVSPDVVSESELVFSVTNTGAEQHRPVVVKTTTPPDQLLVEDGMVDLTGIFIVWPGGGGDFGEWPPEGMEDLFPVLSPGETVEDAARKAGEGHPGLGRYVVLCLIPGHYERGEFGSFEMVAKDG